MTSPLVLVLLVSLGLFYNTPRVLARPSNGVHNGLYDDVKVVPYVDEKIDEPASTFGHYWDKLGNSYGKSLDTTIGGSDKYEKYYDRYRKEFAAGGGDSNESDDDADVLPVEGGTENMASSRRDDVTSIESDETGSYKRYRHRKNHRHNKEAVTSSYKPMDKPEYTEKEENIRPEDIADPEIDFDKLIKEQPDFKKNIATITDTASGTEDADSAINDDGQDGVDSEDYETIEDYYDSIDDDDDDDVSDDEDDDSDDDDDDDVSDDDDFSDETEDDDDYDDDFNSAEDSDDDDVYDDSDNDDDESNIEDGEYEKGDSDDNTTANEKAGQESHDESSEMFQDQEYYDYYDKDFDSSYSSSEVDVDDDSFWEKFDNEKIDGEMPIDWYDRLYGDEPAKDDNDNKITTSDNKDEKKQSSYSKNDKNEDKFYTYKEDIDSKSEDKESQNIPKTDIEPNTSPNPPTPKKDMKPVVTQPVYPDLKDTDAYYIESKPVEACDFDANCSPGRMCKFGLCICGHRELCEGKYKPVCGSDGLLYSSHCELHRTACISSKHILVDHSDKCLDKPNESQPKFKDEKAMPDNTPDIALGQPNPDPSKKEGQTVAFGQPNPDPNKDEQDQAFTLGQPNPDPSKEKEETIVLEEPNPDTKKETEIPIGFGQPNPDPYKDENKHEAQAVPLGQPNPDPNKENKGMALGQPNPDPSKDEGKESVYENKEYIKSRDVEKDALAAGLAENVAKQMIDKNEDKKHTHKKSKLEKKERRKSHKKKHRNERTESADTDFDEKPKYTKTGKDGKPLVDYKNKDEKMQGDAPVEEQVHISDGGLVVVDKESDTVEDGSGDNLVPLFCTPELYLEFKANVLLYHCIFFEEPHCDRQTQEEKQRLAAIMFNYFDHNLNGRIEKEELWEMQLRESIDKISTLCTLVDMPTFDELGETDGKLSPDEFIQAFDIPDVLEHRLEIVPLLATVGNGLEVKCDVTDFPDVIWRRNNVDLATLAFPGISVLGDGSLYLETVGTHHVGNLTCYGKSKPAIKQLHKLTVQQPPKVTVSPPTAEYNHGVNIEIHCHVEGLPRPSVEWHFNGMAIIEGTKYYVDPADYTLTVKTIDYEADSGHYQCVGRNNAGEGEGIAIVSIHSANDTTYTALPAVEDSFIVFHDAGYTMYEPHDCATQRHVQPDYGNFYYIPDELDAAPSMCRDGQPCVWGSAVNVRDRFVYVTQPRQNRILVVDVHNTLNPDQVIFTDHVPVRLHYMDHLDEVWVLCWNGEEDKGTKTIVVVRNASQKTQHHAVHTQPIGNRFDLVQELFLPPDSELHHPYNYGYTAHTGQHGLFKVDLTLKKYLKAIDFTQYACVPKAMAFLPLGGTVFVKCVHTSVTGDTSMILQLDYVTDIVVDNRTMPGTPYVSPDAEYLVVVDEEEGFVSVFDINEHGEISKHFHMSVRTPVGGATFHKSMVVPGYDLYLTSANAPVVFAISLSNGEVNEIQDVGEPDLDMLLPWQQTRPLVSGRVFSDYVATTALSSMVIMNAKQNVVQCGFEGLDNPSVVVSSYLYKN